jgi:hypothetical protein
MQTPIENIEDKCFIVIRFSQLLDTERYRKKEETWSTLMVTKANIDTSAITFDMVAGTADLELAARGERKLCTVSPASAAKGSMTSGPAKVAGGGGGLKLDADLIVTKKFRACDITSYVV